MLELSFCDAAGIVRNAMLYVGNLDFLSKSTVDLTMTSKGNMTSEG